MTVAIPNKTAALAFDQKAMAGVDKYFASAAKLTVAGIDFTPATLKAVFQTDVDATNALDTGRATVKQLTATQRDARAKMRALRKGLRTYLLGNYGEQAVQMLDDFGLVPPKKTVKTVAVKAEAIARSTATRKARNTMGKNQKKPVKGAPATQAAAASTASAK